MCTIQLFFWTHPRFFLYNLFVCLEFNAAFNIYGHFMADSAPFMLSWLTLASTYNTSFHIADYELT